MIINIIVNLEFQAVHNWENCNISKVSFLKNPHRHIFKITAKKEVQHEDRDIEIIMLKNSILSYLTKKYYSDKYGFGDIGSKSCEMLAVEILKKFELNYCQVLEDGENGAEVISKNI